ncbi:MAG TPA: hypothetical protein VIP56_05910, partial [Nitrososphaeraceae archaeon]
MKSFIFAGIFAIMVLFLYSNPSSVIGSSDPSETNDGHEAEPTVEVDDLKLHKVFGRFNFPTGMA